MDKEQRESLLRLRKAVDELLEKDFGDGRGHEIDRAVDYVATTWGRAANQEKRILTLRTVLAGVVDDPSNRTAIAKAKAELAHDTDRFKHMDAEGQRLTIALAGCGWENFL